MLIYTFSQDDDHGYVVGTAIQSVQRPLESTGKEKTWKFQERIWKTRAAKCQSKLHFREKSQSCFSSGGVQIFYECCELFRAILRKTAVKVVPRAFRRRQGEATGATIIRQSNGKVWAGKGTSCFHKVISFEKFSRKIVKIHEILCFQVSSC